MSFILDALRKVDEESRRPDEPLPPVVAIERMRIEKRSRRRHLVVMAAIAAVSAMATAWLLRPRPSTAPEISSAAAPPTVPVNSAAPPLPSLESTIVENASPPPPTTEAVRSPETTPKVVEAAAGEAPLEEEEAMQPEPEPDVTAEAPPPVLEPPRLVLQGTSVLAGRPVAVVSDRRVFEGDIIDGALVIRISERLVELDFNGRRFTLTF